MSLEKRFFKLVSNQTPPVGSKGRGITDSWILWEGEQGTFDKVCKNSGTDIENHKATIREIQEDQNNENKLKALMAFDLPFEQTMMKDDFFDSINDLQGAKNKLRIFISEIDRRITQLGG